MPVRKDVQRVGRASRVIVAALLVVLVLLALPLVPRVLRACGPYFALEILSTREAAVLEPPPRMSVTDGLVPTPGEKLPIDESDNEEARTRVELDGLSPEHADRVKAMRASSNGDAAYSAGEGLPAIVRDYTAGAVSYHNRQLEKARGFFTRVLAVVPADGAREPRVVWARFMLGAIAHLQNDGESATAHWTATRGLVRSGLTDPLGLAVASLGEEARLWLKPGTLAKAVSLYAKQAAYGSERGRASLLMVAEQALGDPVLLDEGLRDPMTRRLILRYLYADGKPETFKRVLDVFEGQRVSHVEGADLLAAQAYAAGNFDLATRLAAYESTPLSAWITGKLALRRGDRQAALRAFADAVKGLPAHHADRGRAMAETGVLHLSGGDFAQAMELFHGAVVDGSGEGYGGTDYWADLAYLAERVLTLDELLPLVDRLAPPLSSAEREAIRKQADALSEEDRPWREEKPAEQLRELAGRRLMRAGRHEEALRYFDADERLQGIAKKYVDALTTARGRWQGQGTRAEAWFTAATIARVNGMELLGYELAPDYAMHDGAYAYFPPKPIDLATATAATATPTVKSPGAATPGERQRVEASKPAIDSRFHYRLTAVDHALASADALPQRSQAFAAVLCRATAWIIDREPERARQVYARYLKEGPYVSWGGNFGRECPPPDFAGAERRRWDERLATVTWIYTRHPLRTIGGVVVIAIAAIGWFTSRRMSRRRAMAQ
jgi:cellulose synthase operon protein C